MVEESFGGEEYLKELDRVLKPGFFSRKPKPEQVHELVTNALLLQNSEVIHKIVVNYEELKRSGFKPEQGDIINILDTVLQNTEFFRENNPIVGKTTYVEGKHTTNGHDTIMRHRGHLLDFRGVVKDINDQFKDTSNELRIAQLNQFGKFLEGVNAFRADDIYALTNNPERFRFGVHFSQNEKEKLEETIANLAGIEDDDLLKREANSLLSDYVLSDRWDKTEGGKTYGEYFSKIRSELDTVVALEIGAWHAPVLDNLRASGKSFFYRGIDRPSDFSKELRSENPVDWKSFAKKLLEDTAEKVTIPWNAKDLPLPFQKEYFTEVHCHLILDNIVRGNELKKGNSSSLPTINEFVEEISRITKPGGVAFISLQYSLFFDLEVSQKGFHDMILELEDEFEKAGYKLEGTLGVKGLYDFSKDWRYSNYELLARKQTNS